MATGGKQQQKRLGREGYFDEELLIELYIYIAICCKGYGRLLYRTVCRVVQNQHVMLPEAAKKVRFLRSDFKRRMEADGKAMTPEQRC